MRGAGSASVQKGSEEFRKSPTRVQQRSAKFKRILGGSRRVQERFREGSRGILERFRGEGVYDLFRGGSEGC